MNSYRTRVSCWFWTSLARFVCHASRVSAFVAEWEVAANLPKIQTAPCHARTSIYKKTATRAVIQMNSGGDGPPFFLCLIGSLSSVDCRSCQSSFQSDDGFSANHAMMRSGGRRRNIQMREVIWHSTVGNGMKVLSWQKLANWTP